MSRLKSIIAKWQDVSVSTGFRFGVFLVLLLAGFYGVEQGLSERRDAAEYQLNERVVVQAAELRGNLENAINSVVFLAHGLEALIVSVDQLSDDQIDAALGRLYKYNSSIRNIGLAPNNVLRYVYPLIGNEAAIGLAYEKLPAQWQGVKRAMDARSSILVGPVTLVQGGRAVINRTPVFLEDGRYWGIISIVIDLEKLLDAAKASENFRQINVQLAGDAVNAAGASWLLGEGTIDRGQAVRMGIRVPGGEWALFAEPQSGWNLNDSSETPLRVGLYSVVIMLATFVLIMLNGRAQARTMAEDLQALNDEISSTNEVLEYMSRYDPLTNVANRRYFNDMLSRGWGTCSRIGVPMSILMVDVDHFKRINDTYGHAVGDVCLVRVATLIMHTLRRTDDLVARYGGEEFIVMALAADRNQAMALGEKIRAVIAGTLIEHSQTSLPPLRMTVSVGVATCLPGASTSASVLCTESDQALYRAKDAGRNKVVHYAAS